MTRCFHLWLRGVARSSVGSHGRRLRHFFGAGSSCLWHWWIWLTAGFAIVVREVSGPLSLRELCHEPRTDCPHLLLRRGGATPLPLWLAPGMLGKIGGRVGEPVLPTDRWLWGCGICPLFCSRRQQGCALRHHFQSSTEPLQSSPFVLTAGRSPFKLQAAQGLEEA